MSLPAPQIPDNAPANLDPGQPNGPNVAQSTPKTPRQRARKPSETRTADSTGQDKVCEAVEVEVEEKPRNVGGRPRIIQSPEEFDRRVDAYLEACRPKGEDDPGDVVTMTGMVLALGFCGRDALDDYAKRDGFSLSVKRARALIEHAYERKLDRDKCTGAIFALKNMGWSDRTEVDSRQVVAHVDYGRLTDDQIRRIAAGEALGSVLAGAVAEHAARLTAGEVVDEGS